jgi:HAD superfamily hydrolase (TIGR01509 family)
MSVAGSRAAGGGRGRSPRRSSGVLVRGGGRSFGRFQAFIFNMDGVVTDTARLHAAAWRATFDRYLPGLSADSGVRYVAFDPGEDYRTHMDGRLRYEAAARFLAARGITVPYGAPTDPPGPDTICGLANDNHARFATRLQAHGVDVYPATVALLGRLRPSRVGLGVVSSSRSCEAVLRATGLGDTFDVVVGGIQMEDLGLPGKPDPSAFLEAARRLDVSPRSGVVVEDAVVGVQAARAAGFGLVVGLAHDSPPRFRAQLSSADIVVSELDELDVTADTPDR